MASYFFALTILVVISVAYGHGGSEGRGGSESRGEGERNRDGSEHNAFSGVFGAFIQSLNATQREAFFNIIHNWNLTKAERQEQADSFSTGLEGEAKILYQNISVTFQQFRANLTQRLQDAVANLSDATARTVGGEILALINNQSISDAATSKAIVELIKNQTPEVQRELESLWPHVYAHQDPFHQGGSEHYAFYYVFGKFIQSLNATQRDTFFNITRNWNLTKAERQAQVDTWSAGLEGEAKVLYQNLSATFQEFKANFTQKLQAAVDNLNATAKAVGEEILALINNQSISDAATFKAVEDLVKAQTPDVRKELESVLPHVDAHRKNSFHCEQGNDNRNSAHGSENGNSAHGGERLNSAHGSENGNSAHGGERGNSAHRSENGNSAHGGERGNSAHGSENGNSEHGRQQHENRAKRLIK